jgi:hypothetical protein
MPVNLKASCCSAVSFGFRGFLSPIARPSKC